MRRSAQAGFGLMEAIVALTLLAAAALPTALGLSAALTAARRTEAAMLELEMQANALSALRAINPMAQPEGALDLGPYRMVWRAAELEQPRPAVNPLGESGVWIVQAFDVVISVEDDTGVRARLTARQIGFGPAR